MVSHPHRLISDVMVERVPAAMDYTVYEWGGVGRRGDVWEHTAGL